MNTFEWNGKWTDGIDHTNDDYKRFVMNKMCKNCGESLGIHAEGRCTKDNRSLLRFNYRGGMFQDGSFEHEDGMLQDGSYK